MIGEVQSGERQYRIHRIELQHDEDLDNRVASAPIYWLSFKTKKTLD
jgi:hypothetical protein